MILIISSIAAIFAFALGWRVRGWYQDRTRKLIGWRVAQSQYTNCSETVELRYSDRTVVVAYHVKSDGWRVSGCAAPARIWNDAERAVFCHRNGPGLSDPNIEIEVEAVMKRLREPI